MKDIALIGKARSGKDSVAQVLCEEFGYRRLAFADELKKAALRIDPIVDVGPGGCSGLAYTVRNVGWERVKDELPIARTFLQNLGHAMRQIDEEIWIQPVIGAWIDNHLAGTPTVVTDCRYQNEADILRRNGFLLVRVVRPGTGGDGHVSETELDGFPADVLLDNSGSLEHLVHQVRCLAAVVGA